MVQFHRFGLVIPSLTFYFAKQLALRCLGADCFGAHLHRDVPGELWVLLDAAVEGGSSNSAVFVASGAPQKGEMVKSLSKENAWLYRKDQEIFARG